MQTVAIFESTHAPFDPDIVREIIRNNRDLQVEAPILAMCLTQGRTMRVGNQTFTWNSADLPTRTTTINNGGTAYTAGDTSIVVASGAVFLPGDLVVCEATREVLYISAISTNTLTVIRGVGSANGGVAAGTAGVANTAVLRRIGPAMGEASPTPADRDFVSVTHTQTIQTYKVAVSVSGRAAVLDAQVEEPEAFQRAQAFQMFQRDIEHVILFGGRTVTGVTDAGSRLATTSQGLYNAITNNTFAVGGTMTKAYFEGTVCNPVFSRGSGEKFLVAGPTLFQTLHDLYATNTARNEQVDVAGMRLRRLVTPHGDLNMVPSRALAGGFAGDGLILDMGPQVMLRYTDGDVGGRPRNGLPNLRPVLLADGTDAVREEWFAELALQFGSQAQHARISGVTGASS
ncbi:MAG: hypothetical protein ACKVZJ_10320 [Phycisphaerales bacterium]